MTIIASALTPVPSIGVQVQVTNGRNQVQRSAGKYAALYLSAGCRLGETQMELGAGETFYSTPGETTNNLVLYTSAPVSFTGTVSSGGNVLTMVVSRMLVLDSPLTNYSFTNNGTDPILVNLNSSNLANLSPISPLYFGVADLPAAYNSAFVLSLGSIVDADKNQTFTVNATAGKYIYYCYPLIEGQSSFTVNGFEGGIGLVGTVTIQTPQGLLQYYVYQSDNAGLGGTTVAVSSAPAEA